MQQAGRRKHLANASGELRPILTRGPQNQYAYSPEDLKLSLQTSFLALRSLSIFGKSCGSATELLSFMKQIAYAGRLTEDVFLRLDEESIAQRLIGLISTSLGGKLE